MKKLTLLVGPPGSGKSTLANSLIYDDGDHGLGTVYINQDSQKEQHLVRFSEAIKAGKDIIVDRLNFNKGQRNRYLDPAKAADYYTKIIVLHESYDTCLKRCIEREDHLTIKDEATAKKALHMFFTKYERVEDNEADKVDRRWPEGDKPLVVISDLDGTLCNTDHRQHHVRNGNKNWKAFFDGIPQDKPNQWCVDIIKTMSDYYEIVYCSGRGEEERGKTASWLGKYDLLHFNSPIFKKRTNTEIFMRRIGDYRKDSIIKEILLDYEILSRYTPYFFIDDRQQVVDMYRSRGYTVLQCAKGDF